MSKLNIVVGKWYKTRGGRVLQCVGRRINIIAIPRYKEETYFLFPISGCGTYAVQENGCIFLNDTDDDIVAEHCKCKG